LFDVSLEILTHIPVVVFKFVFKYMKDDNNTKGKRNNVVACKNYIESIELE